MVGHSRGDDLDHGICEETAMFAVVGVTGKVGRAVARSLLDADQSVRAVVRDAAKGSAGSAWASRGCEVATADLDNVAPLAAAFTDVGGVFAMLPPIFDPKPGFPEAKAMIGTLRAALAEALPPKLVVLSTVGADAGQPNLLNQLGLLEQALADLPIRITFYGPGGSWRTRPQTSRRPSTPASSEATSNRSITQSRWSRPRTSGGLRLRYCRRSGSAIASSSSRPRE
jgi:NmrA-like family